MPTILELFRGSGKDIKPKILDQTPVQDRFEGSTQQSAIQPNRTTVLRASDGPSGIIRFIGGILSTGIRFTSKVELNNPRIYGNQAIRIATRSTADVEKMKQATNGDAATGGLIGKALGFVTDGFIGKIAFGGRVTSLSGARNAINSRLGIPQNLIPTAVINTGGLQTGIEPNTMITLAKIKKDGAGTELGKFLKNTGGGNPKTLGRQALGQGITLVKDSVRKSLFGSPATTGINNPTPFLSSYGIFEYTSKSPYSSQINNEKFSTKKLPTATDTEATNITKKVTQLREDAKKKLGEASANATASLKQRLKGTESKPEIDKVLESKTKETSATPKTYEEKYNKLVERDSVETNLKLTDLGKITEAKKDVAKKEEVKKPLGIPEGSIKNQLKGTSDKSKPAINAAVEKENKETTPADDINYTKSLGDYKNEDVSERIDLSLVSPIKGIDRRRTKGRYGKTEYALFDPKNTTGIFSPNDPTRPYTGVAGSQQKLSIESRYAITNKRDGVNQLAHGLSTDLLGDWIPFQIGSVGDGDKIIHFRTLITGFSETVTPSWDSSKFVGNPYNFYTYSGVERSASFTLRMYCMSAEELAMMWLKINFLTSKAYPTIVDKLVNPPFIKMTIGSIYKNRIGFINSLSYTINDDVTWESDIKDMYLPKVVDVQIEFKLVESAGVETKPFYNYGLATAVVTGINNKRAQPSDSVVGTDPITNPQPAAGANFKKVEGIQEVVIPPPPKIDSTGVEQTEVPTPKTDTTPKKLDTGKPAETPKAAVTPEATSEVVKRSEPAIIEIKKKVEGKYSQYPDFAASVFRMAEVRRRKISNITKIDESNYYYEWEDEVGNTAEQVITLISSSNGKASSNTSEYFIWSAANNGKDPLSKLAKKNDEDVLLPTTGYAQN